MDHIISAVIQAVVYSQQDKTSLAQYLRISTTGRVSIFCWAIFTYKEARAGRIYPFFSIHGSQISPRMFVLTLCPQKAHVQCMKAPRNYFIRRHYDTKYRYPRGFECCFSRAMRRYDPPEYNNFDILANRRLYDLWQRKTLKIYPLERCSLVIVIPKMKEGSWLTPAQGLDGTLTNAQPVCGFGIWALLQNGPIFDRIPWWIKQYRYTWKNWQDTLNQFIVAAW